MVINAGMNETGPSAFSATVSGGGMAAIDAALDTIFAHPNVPPFVSKQLIQRLVTSNPSPPISTASPASSRTMARACVAT